MKDFSHDPNSEAVEVLGADRKGQWLFLCDHATNAVPDWLGGSLGLPAEDMARHIAYDVGAAGVTRELGALLDAPAVLSKFSRLVIDPNRAEDDPTLVMQVYDGTIIPGNRSVPPAGIAERLERLYRPYHNAVAKLAEARPNPILVSVHSFTPRLSGRRPRPWHVGVLTASDRRIGKPIIDLLRADPDLCVGDNEPYTGALKGDAMDRHGVQTGRPHVLIEIRNDLIGSRQDQRNWAERLAPLLIKALSIARL